MSLSDRRTFLTLLAVAPLAACGFTPVYGPRGSGNVLRGRIRIQPPDTRLGFELVSRLEDRIGRATAPTHVLTFDIETDDRNLAITGTEDITRVNINGSVTYRLTESGSDVQIEAGTVSTFTAYSTTGSPVSTTAARRDAEDRLMIALADQIISRLLSDAGTWQ
jgi:LPS-assembly lipoprotein